MKVKLSVTNFLKSIIQAYRALPFSGQPMLHFLPHQTQQLFDLLIKMGEIREGLAPRCVSDDIHRPSVTYSSFASLTSSIFPSPISLYQRIHSPSYITRLSLSLNQPFAAGPEWPAVPITYTVSF